MQWFGWRRKRKNVMPLDGSPKGKDQKFDKTNSSKGPLSPRGSKHKESRHIDPHAGPIRSLAFLTDEKQIIGGCEDGTIQCWNTSDHQEIGPTMKSGGALRSMAVSKDGMWIASGGVDRKVTIWNAVDHQKVCESAELYGKAVIALDISSDSSYVAAGSEDGSVIIWDLANGKRITGPLKHQESQVSSVKFSPAGDRLASACTGWDCPSIHIWHSCTGKLLGSLTADNQPTYSLAWSRDDQRLFAGGPRGSIRCFDVKTQSIQSRLGDQLSDSVTAICVSNNDRFLVAGSASGCSLNLWDVNTCQLIRPTFFQQSEVLAIAISPNDQDLAIGGMDQRISIRNLSDTVPVSYFFHRLTPSLKHSEPFTYMSNAVHEAWIHGRLEMTEEILSEEITNPGYPDFVPYSLANRALVRARMRKWDEALEDAQTMLSKDADVPPVAYVAKAFALSGQGKRQEATEAFNSVPGFCNRDAGSFIDLIKFIMLFEAGHHDEAEVAGYDINPMDCILDVKPIRSVVKAQMLTILAERSIGEPNRDKAIQLLTKAKDLGPFTQVPELGTISLIFGWNLSGLELTIHQKYCSALLDSGRVREAIDSLLAMQRDLKEKVDVKKDWFRGFEEQCLQACESLGEEAMRNGDHDDAIAWYSAALDVNPASPEHILMKRSEAYAARGSWENALAGAEEVMRWNPSLPQAHDMKQLALRNLGQYDEIIKIWNEQPDEKLYHQQADARMVIDRVVAETLHEAPLRMIDTKTGRLCEGGRLQSAFKDDPVFHHLVVSVTECMDAGYIERVVKGFFRYVMFSHRWEDKEPLYGDVGDRSVYDLPTDEMRTVIKLQTFCNIAGGAGYRWAWSDTCCIDQKNQREFEKSINSMFKWYRGSSLTLVYLRDVLSSSLPGALMRSVWITRGWTLQEFLAPRVIQFFSADWTPYLSIPQANHKESDVIMTEIADAVSIPAKDLLSFRPSSDNVRWKLYMASKRDTTMPEDVAYCLWGIFDVAMSVIPGESQQRAVGRLLQEVIANSKSGDVGCLAWVGEPSELNSCLPINIKAYGGPCHTPASIGEDAMQGLVSELESSFSSQEQDQALVFYERLSHQRRAEFAGWHLRLPCVAFRVSAIYLDRRLDTTIDYVARATGLEETSISTKDRLPSKGLWLVCPWIHELLDLNQPYGSHQDEETDVDPSSSHPSEMREGSVRGGSIRPPMRDNDPSQSDHLTVHDDPSTPSSVLPPSPSAIFDQRTRALRLVARIRQPMTALLLLADRRPGVYKRVATDHDIVIQVDKKVPLDGIDVKVVEIM